MMRLAFTFLIILTLPAKAGSFGIFSLNGSSTFAPYSAWFYDPNNNGSTVTAYIAAGGIPSTLKTMESDTGAAPTILAAGFKYMTAMTAYAAICYNNEPTGCTSGNINPGRPFIESLIDSLVSAGASIIICNEPDLTYSGSATGFNGVYNYIHTAHPGVLFGIVEGDDTSILGLLNTASAGSLLPVIDIAADEWYNSAASKPNPWSALQAAYPTVKVMTTVYSTTSLCYQGVDNSNPNWLLPKANGGSLDYVAFWDIDNNWTFAATSYSDGDWPANANLFATNPTSFAICGFPASQPLLASNSTLSTGSNTIQVGDFTNWTQTSSNTLANCQYEVISGANAVNGINDPGNTITVPWASRACESPPGGGSPVNITVTAGSGGNCPISGAFTCLVLVRAHTSGGQVGNVTYGTYNVP